jgi:hypothetical protein
MVKEERILLFGLGPMKFYSILKINVSYYLSGSNQFDSGSFYRDFHKKYPYLFMHIRVRVPYIHDNIEDGCSRTIEVIIRKSRIICSF